MTAREREVAEIESLMCAILAGRAPEVQGAALACLLATWLAGHFATAGNVRGDDDNALRERLLRMHIAAVRELVPVEVDRIKGRTP